jgi:uncharacterized protein
MKLPRAIESVIHPLKRGRPIEIGGRQFLPAAVITGASEGLGKAFAQLLARELAVVLVARNADDLRSTSEEISANIPVANIQIFALDITPDDAPAALHAFLDNAGLYADILINNAGVGLGGRFDAQDRREVLGIVDLNVRSLVAMTHEFLPGMRERGTGGILNLASLAGFMPGPWQALYFASKSFVLSYSQAIAAENSSAGIQVMAAAPGPVETRIHSSMRARWTWYRALFPSYSAEACAKAIWEGFEGGHRVFVPGLINNISALAARVLPNEVMVPLIGWLVRPRYRNGRAVD